MSSLNLGRLILANASIRVTKSFSGRNAQIKPMASESPGVL
jgi:hypothetical protein